MGRDDHLDLGQEPLDPKNREFRPEDLDGNAAIVLQIAPEVDCRHAFGADLATDRVPIGEGRLEGSQYFTHRTPLGPPAAGSSSEKLASPAVSES